MAEVVELAPHELMELHELLNMKTTSVAKMKAIDGMVTDKDLKVLLQGHLQLCLQGLDELKAMMAVQATLGDTNLEDRLM